MAIWALNRVNRVLSMEAATLADQFRDLQLKQHERLKARVAKLQAKSPLQRPDADGIGLSEDLGLMTATQERELGFAGDGTNDKTTHTAPVGGEAPYAGARIKELSQEVEQLKAENERLTSRLKSSEKRVEVAERTLETEREDLGGGPTAAQKIVELSKKNRALHAELAGERNRVRQLEKAVRTATQHAQEVYDRESKTDAQESQEDLKVQLGDVQEQLIQAKSKAADLNNQCQQLRHDLKMAQLVIAREVGEGVTVSSLLNRQSGWRGRSQQIIILQNKLSQLRKSAHGRAAHNGELNETCGSISSREGGGGEGRVEARQRAALEKIERERRQNLVTVRMELEKVQGECGHFRKECTALRARNKILTESLKSGPLAPCKRTEQRVVVSGDSTAFQELEQRAEKLEEKNQNLRRQLRESKRALHRSQHNIQPATSGSPSLPPLVHQQQTRHSRPQSRIKLDRQILSAGTAGVTLKASSLREAQMLIRLAETERDRLAERATTLQQRLASAEEELVRLKTEKVTSGPLVRPRGAHQTSSCRKRPHPATGGSTSDRVSALEAELVIQRDENTVLRETLAQLRREKLEGARLLHSKLQDTRRMWVEMANSYSPTAQQLQ